MIKNTFSIWGAAIALGFCGALLAATTMPRTNAITLPESARVTDYGARCDGVTDDAAAFNKAINSAQRVFVPAGTCVLSSVTLKANTAMYGVGSAAILKQGAAPRAMLQADSGSASIANNIPGIVVRDMQLRGTVDVHGFSEHVHLLALSGVSNAVIERVTFRGFRGDGIYFGSSQTSGLERHNVQRQGSKQRLRRNQQ
jgi:polygalacturonase